MGDHADDARAWDESRQSRDLFEETRTYTVPEVARSTDMAILCVMPGLGERWIPRSQVAPDSDVQDKGDSGALIISEWLAGRLDDEAAGSASPRRAAPTASPDALRSTAAAIRARRGFGSPT